MSKIEDAIGEWWLYAKKSGTESSALNQLKRDYTQAGRGARVLADEINRRSDIKITAAGLLSYLKKNGLKSEPSRFNKSTGPTRKQLEVENIKLRKQQEAYKKGLKKLARDIRPYKKQEQTVAKVKDFSTWDAVKIGRKEKTMREYLKDKYLR